MINFTFFQLEQAASFFFFGFIELSVLFLGVSFFVEILNELMNPKKVQKILSSNRVCKSGFIITFILSFKSSRLSLYAKKSSIFGLC
mgnify:CR=1 FL=1